MARWRSSYAAVCKTAYTGANPVRASKSMNDGESIQLGGCVIPDGDGRILLLHSIGHNWWEIPGGKVEPGESGRQATIREICEELGFAVELNKRLVKLHYTYSEKTFDHDLFLAKTMPNLGRLKPNEPDNHDEIRFHNLGRYGIGAINLSPAAGMLSRLIINGEVQLA